MTATVAASERFSKDHPCPICDGYPALPRGQGIRCTGYQNGSYARCSRDEHAGTLPRNEDDTYSHLLTGPCRCGRTHGDAPFIANGAHQPPPPNSAPPRIFRDFREAGATCAYDYPDETEHVAFQVWRYMRGNGEKSFAPARRVDGGWALGLGGAKLPLYRLSGLLAADPSAWVLIVEGEKDADRLAALGFIATTNAGGAGKWRPEYTAALKGRRVVLLPDNDEPGDRHAHAVAASLQGVAAEVRVLRLPGLLAKGDVSDWLDAGHTRDDLDRLIDETLAWTPMTEPEPVSGAARKVRFLTARQFAAATPDQTEWAVEPFAPLGGIAKIDGQPKKAGKTTLITYMVRAVLTGEPFLGRPTTQGPVILLTEQGGTSFREALGRAGLLERDDLYIATYRDLASLSWPDVVAEAFAMARDVGAVLLIVDTLPACSRVRGDDENSAGRALEALEPLQVGAETAHIAVVVSFHDRKGGGEVGESGRGSSAYAGAVDVILHVSKPGGNLNPTIRKIEALSRFAATPDELYIELTPTGYVSLGSEDDVVTAAITRALPDVLPKTEDEAKPIGSRKRDGEIIERGILDDLADAGVKAARSTVDAELGRWIDGGFVGQNGGGKKGSPHRYWLIATPPESFFRFKPPHPSEETNAAATTATATQTRDADESGQMHSSDAPSPSEERIYNPDSPADEDAFLSSDAPDAYSGRNNAGAVLTGSTWERI